MLPIPAFDKHNIDFDPARYIPTIIATAPPSSVAVIIFVFSFSQYFIKVSNTEQGT